MNKALATLLMSSILFAALFFIDHDLRLSTITEIFTEPFTYFYLGLSLFFGYLTTHQLFKKNNIKS
jgi:hypothetical protein